MATAAAPKNVSPLIRLQLVDGKFLSTMQAARYVALFSGIAYGSRRLSKLQAYETDLQKREDAIKERKAIRASKLRAEAERENLIDLAKTCGVKPTHPDFKDLPEFKDMK